MEILYMETQVGLKTIALTLFLNLFFYFLLQMLCVMISHWLTVLKYKMPSQILIKTLDWFGKCRAVVAAWLNWASHYSKDNWFQLFLNQFSKFLFLSCGKFPELFKSPPTLAMRMRRSLQNSKKQEPMFFWTQCMYNWQCHFLNGVRVRACKSGIFC